MAYTRFSGKHYRRGGWTGNIPPSETYIYGGYHHLHCCACRFMKTPAKNGGFFWDDFTTNSRTAMLKHIRKHRKAGHAVPRAAWRRLVREIRTMGDEY